MNLLKNEEILLVLSVDISFDQVNFLENPKLTTKNLELLPHISEIIEKGFSSSCKSKTTWLVPDENKILEKMQLLSNNIIKENDEVGLHCLISKKNNFDEMGNESIEKYLDSSFDLLNNYKIFPKSIRIAGCAGNNKLFSHLESRGIKVDSSAIPNRVRDTNVKFNWKKTTQKPYFPSKMNYQVTDDNIKKCHKILEVPLTTIPTKMPYDKIPVYRYLDLGYKKENIVNELDKIIQNNSLLVTIIHPMELIQKESIHPLYSNTLQNFKENLSSITQISEKYNKKVRCVNLIDLYNLFLKND